MILFQIYYQTLFWRSERLTGSCNPHQRLSASFIVISLMIYIIRFCDHLKSFYLI